jgi:heme-degrading monooxygenase HmoA
MDDWCLAQANVARLRHPPNDPRSVEFIAALARVNHLAERSPGFVWRHTAPEGHVNVADGDSLLVINLSVWRSYQDLHAFTYRSRHGHYVRRRREWSDRVAQPNTVLWWVATGSTPTVDEANTRLDLLRRYGSHLQAFSIRSRFHPDGRPERAWSGTRARRAR